jgi:hypothetical protein
MGASFKIGGGLEIEGYESQIHEKAYRNHP